MSPTPQQILKILMDTYGMKREDLETALLKNNGNLTTDAGLDSLDVTELVMEIERAFGIVLEEGPDNFATMPFQEFMNRIANAPTAHASQPKEAKAQRGSNPASQPRYNAAGQRLTPAPHMAQYQPKDADDTVIWDPTGTKRILTPRGPTQ